MVKQFFITHMNFWYLYLMSIFMLWFGAVMTLIYAPFSLANFSSAKSALVACSLVFSLVSTALLFVPNYVTAKRSTNHGMVIFVLTIVYQLIVMAPMFVIAYLFLQGFISEFN